MNLNHKFKSKGISVHFYREAKIMAAMPFILMGLALLGGLLVPRPIRYLASY